MVEKSDTLESTLESKENFENLCHKKRRSGCSKWNKNVLDSHINWKNNSVMSILLFSEFRFNNHKSMLFSCSYSRIHWRGVILNLKFIYVRQYCTWKWHTLSHRTIRIGNKFCCAWVALELVDIKLWNVLQISVKQSNSQ